MNSNEKNTQGTPPQPTGNNIPPAPPPIDSPRDIRDTTPWKSSKRTLGKFWFNYKAFLADSFKGMSRTEQESLVGQFCIVFTIGVTVLICLLFYQFVPTIVRVCGVPLAIVAAWWASKSIVTPVVLARLEGLLNK